MTPRFRIWLKSIGLTPKEYEEARKVAGQEGGPSVLLVNGTEVPVGRTYLRWTMQHWTEWAHMLGFYGTVNGEEPHHQALWSGYRHADFDAWMQAKYGGGS